MLRTLESLPNADSKYCDDDIKTLTKEIRYIR